MRGARTSGHATSSSGARRGVARARHTRRRRDRGAPSGHHLPRARTGRAGPPPLHTPAMRAPASGANTHGAAGPAPAPAPAPSVGCASDMVNRAVGNTGWGESESGGCGEGAEVVAAVRGGLRPYGATWEAQRDMQMRRRPDQGLLMRLSRRPQLVQTPGAPYRCAGGPAIRRRATFVRAHVSSAQQPRFQRPRLTPPPPPAARSRRPAPPGRAR